MAAVLGGSMAQFKMWTAYAKRANPVQLTSILAELPMGMAIGCASELGNGSHYQHEGDSAYWVIFGSHDIASLHLKYIPLGDAERVNIEIVKLRHFSDDTFAFAIERAIKSKSVRPH
jgi:hypothetical protein